MKHATWMAVLALACAGEGEPAPRLTVELDAFSGRPNPTWALTTSEAEEVLERLRELPPSGAPIPDRGLGYRGFSLTGTGEGWSGPAYVSSGLIMIGSPDRGGTYQDAHGLESYLMDLARARGYGGVLEDR